MENSREMGRGWPLGLGSIYVRVTATTTATIASIEPAGSVYVNVPSTTYSSFSSSNLDTESTISFFQDNSKTLGRLIGIRSRNNTRRPERLLRSSTDREHDRLEEQRRRRTFLEHEDRDEYCTNDVDIKMCSCFCVPLCLLSKTNTTKHKLNELN